MNPGGDCYWNCDNPTYDKHPKTNNKQGPREQSEVFVGFRNAFESLCLQVILVMALPWQIPEQCGNPKDKSQNHSRAFFGDVFCFHDCVEIDA